MDFGDLQLNLDSLEDEDIQQQESWAVGQDGSLRHCATGIMIGESGLRDIDVSEIEVDQTNLLGRGAGGVVCRAVHKPSGMPLAVKVVRVEIKEKRDQLLNEIRTMMRIKSHFLVDLIDAYVHKDTGCVHVALGYMDYGSLADVQRRVERVPEHLLALVCMQILEGLKMLHLSNIVHRDVKLGNILVNSRGVVKVTDFGISKNLGDSLNVCETFVGTATHMSPERVLGEDYGFSADIWALGLCVYQLACGVYPYGSVSSFPVLFDNLCHRPEPRLKTPKYSTELCYFVELQLQKRPELRASAIQLQASDFILNNLPKVSESALIRWLADVMSDKTRKSATMR